MSEPPSVPSPSISLNEWVVNLPPAPLHSTYALVEQLQKDGVMIHNFGIGEMQPAILVPDAVKEGMKDAIDSNKMYYTNRKGDAELLQALSDDFSRNYGLKYTTNQIIICAGPKDAMFKACFVLLSPTAHRNRAIAFTPAYEGFEQHPLLLTGKPPIRLATDNQFYPVVEELEKVLATDDTIAVIFLNSPNNPSGAVYPESLLERLANVIRKYPEVAVVFDEVYRTVFYDDHKFINTAKFIPQQTILIGGASKEIAGTGIRLGYIAGPEEFMACVSKVQAAASVCVSLPTQLGYAKFLRADMDMKQRFEIRDKLLEKRNYFLSEVKKHSELDILHFNNPQGAFYFFPSVTGLYGMQRPDGKIIGNSDQDVSTFLTEIAHVVTLPGELYGRSGHIRIAYASKTLKEIEEGVQAMADAIAKLTPYVKEQ